jgi:acetyl esterase/lipase
MQTVRKLLLLLLLAASLSTSQGQTGVNYTRMEDVIYARKFGTALTLDVFKPEKANGAGVILIVSGGFYSSHDGINPSYFKVFLDRGYTVFAVVHGSQPRFIIPEIMQDIHRAVRFIRHNAAQYGVDPNKLGATGASAGGHLTLTLATQGGPGKEADKDPVERESSAVQAAACFFPPVDFLNWGKPGDDAVGIGTLAAFKPAFGPRSDTAEGRQALSREISPLDFVRSNQPPTLIIHGEADRLVPIYQAQIYQKKAQDMGNVVKLEVRPGKDHGWPGIEKDMEVFANWFDEQLRGIKKPE